MKTTKLLTSLLCQLLLITQLYSQNSSIYYVSASGGDGDGLSEANPWSYAIFNTKTLTPGTTVLFRRGDTFFGPLSIQSGTVDQLNTYATYGDGPNPVFSGFTVANQWTPVGNNIYWTSLDVPELNVVSLNGSVQAMGRYPRTGYLIYDNHNGNQYINSAAQFPFNPTGAEVVIRKIRQVTDRHLVTAYYDNNLSLSSGGYGVYGSNSIYQPQDSNGFFIQGSLYTLTELGDWYYDRAARRLYMHFGGNSPDQYQVKMSSVPVLAQLNNIHHVKLQELAFEGANRVIMHSNNGNSITLANCDFSQSHNGLAADNGMSDLLLQGGSMTDLTNRGFFVAQMGSNIKIDGVTLRNIGSIPGAGDSGDAMQLGIWAMGDNLTVTNCSLENIGFHGIVLHGNHTLVEKNKIDHYGLVKDDCGAVYNFQFTGVTHTDKIIRNNIILNGVGVAAGAPWYARYGQAAAIYLDANVNNVQISNNVLAYGSWGGIMLAGAGANNEITHNLTYDFGQGLLIHNFTDQSIRALTVTDNTFIARTSQQSAMYLHMFANDNPAEYGTFSHNIYARPIDESNTIIINREYSGGDGLKMFTLADWQATYGQDAGSLKSAVSVDRDSDFRFDYNSTDQNLSVSLNGMYSDVSNTARTSTITLPAFGGSVMINTSDVNSVDNCVATGTIRYERWDNVPGVFIQDIPLQTNPTFTQPITSFEGPVDIADNYATRIRGYVCVPQTGEYTFWIAGDDASELWLSTDENPANKVKIAYVDGWTYYREWNKYSSQKSVTIPLQVGKKYYIEALHKEGGGGDNISVGWQLPDGTVQAPLPGRYLASYDPTSSGGRVANLGTMVERTAETNGELTVFPNPFSTQADIEFTVKESGSANVMLYNAKGQLIKKLFSGTTEANDKVKFTTNTEHLPGGTYLIRLENKKNVLIKKAVLVP